LRAIALAAAGDHRRVGPLKRAGRASAPGVGGALRQRTASALCVSALLPRAASVPRSDRPNPRTQVCVRYMVDKRKAGAGDGAVTRKKATAMGATNTATNTAIESDTEADPETDPEADP